VIGWNRSEVVVPRPWLECAHSGADFLVAVN
jgi:hypothetical protein